VYPISGRPRSLVVFWSRFPSLLYTRSAPQSCLSGHGSRNPLPVSPHRAGHLPSRTHDTDFFLLLFAATGCLLMTNSITMHWQSYRRFQVNFASAGDAAQFVNAIRPVCPCKENANGPPPTPQIPQNKLPVATSVSIQSPHTLVRYHTTAPQRPSMPPPSSAGAACSSQEEPSSSQRALSRFTLPPSSPELSLPPSSSSDLAAAPPHPILGLYTSSSRASSTLPELHSSQFTVAEQGTGLSSMSPLPTLSQPTSSAATLAPPLPSVSQCPEEGKTREAFLESLREAPELYKLARPELENLVSVVVREPGFPRLVGLQFHIFLRRCLSWTACSMLDVPSARSAGLDVGHPRIFRAMSG
jgi:hypothetical protein